MKTKLVEVLYLHYGWGDERPMVEVVRSTPTDCGWEDVANEYALTPSRVRRLRRLEAAGMITLVLDHLNHPGVCLTYKPATVEAVSILLRRTLCVFLKVPGRNTSSDLVEFMAVQGLITAAGIGVRDLDDAITQRAARHEQ